jgi:PKD repeat protein
VSYSQDCFADFYSINDENNPLKVYFFDVSTSSDSVIAWAWHFGDGFTSNLQNPIHTYNSQGEYNVVFMIQTTSGCRDTTINFIIAGDSAFYCSADFDYASASADNLKIDFWGIFDVNDISSVNWEWDFGDGMKKTGFDEILNSNADHRSSLGSKVYRKDALRGGV